jgi:ABC-2 type transport system permease protein
VAQAYTFLLIAWFYGVEAPPLGYLSVLPALILSGLMLGALGLLLSSLIRQLENFAGVMNFVIFPMFFLSTSLYPLWKLQESSEVLTILAAYNPFSQAVEMIRFALYERFNGYASLYTAASLTLFLVLAILGYNPSKGMMQKKGVGS